MDLTQLLTTVQESGGTEIHLKVGSPPLVRQNKFLRKLALPAVQPGDIAGVVKQALSPEELAKFNQQRQFEGNFFGGAPCNFRLNLFQAQSQTMAIIRLIRKAVPNFAEISLPPALEALTEAKAGLVILAGPCRSGISTSLAAFVERINQGRSAHVLLFEDPIEFSFEPKKCRITQRQFKKDLYSIESGINFAKRMDVDVLVIGDLKRELPFRSILEYVAGGNFVVLSMQTLGIQNTLEKILYAFPESDRPYIGNVLATSLLGICSQALLLNPGSKKLVPIHEVFISNSTMAGILQKGRVNQIEPNLRSAGEGSITFEQSAGRLIRDGMPKDVLDAFMTMYRGVKSA
ncbi:MAG TPA: ATPase, T2SS/T4P/T4SS family [Candidatus Ozemobacteraceae bacterium]